MDLEIVVAHHEESLLWLKRIPSEFGRSIYSKGSNPPPNATVLRNFGREAHTYLHHIVQRYDSLAAITVFCQGHPFDHASDFHRTLRGLADKSLHPALFQWLGFIIDTDDSRGRRLFINWSKNPDHHELDLDLLYEKLFEQPCPHLFPFYVGGQFVVRREAVLSRSRAFYERARELSLEIENAAHCYERLWDRIFGVTGVDPALLDGESCAYLKLIKRLQEADPGIEKKSRH